MPLRQTDIANTLADGAIGLAAMTLPIWHQTIKQGFNLYIAALGAALVTVRLAIAAVRLWRDLKRRDDDVH